jgi:hypothetical protein
MQAALSTGTLLSHALGTGQYVAPDTLSLPLVLATDIPSTSTPAHVLKDLPSQPEEPPRVSL